MPKLVKLYITQTLIGFAIAAAFVGVLLYLNVANLWHLVTHSDVGVLAVFLLWLFHGSFFRAFNSASPSCGWQSATMTGAGSGTTFPYEPNLWPFPSRGAIIAKAKAKG